MASAAELRSHALASLPEGWDLRVEERSPAHAVLHLVPPEHADDEAHLRARAAVALVVDGMRPAGVRIDVEVETRVSLLGPDDVDFAAQLRALRGDFGACASCGEAFGRGELQVATEGGPTHPGCVRLGTCPGCYRPVTKRERRVLHQGRPTHADCYEAAESNAHLERERAAALAREKEKKARRADLAIRVVTDARSSEAIVGVVVPASRLEDLATDIAHGGGQSWDAARTRGRLAVNTRERKAISWPDSRGMVVLEAAEALDPGTPRGGYARVYVSHEAMADRPQLPGVVASCFYLHSDKVITEEP
jgi:hypothetical protein